MRDTRIFKISCFSALLLIFVLGDVRAISAQVKRPALAALPLVFEANKGQIPAPYRFLARRGGMDTLYRADGLEILFPKSRSAVARLGINWSNASKSSRLEGEERLPGRSNYLLGRHPLLWIRGVPQFAEIKYSQIYAGVNLVFHGTGNTLEQDFVLAPGADATQIGMRFGRTVRLTKAGNLVIAAGESAIRVARPVAYQDIGGSRKYVKARFLLAGDREVKFALGSYDRTKPLIVDPVFGFSTYLDGSAADFIQAATTDPAGNVYLTGWTNSTDFPIVNGLQTTCAGSFCSDVFISKLDPTGHTLLYSTYIGGSGGDNAYSIGLDPSGNILVAGLSSSSDFPLAGSVQPFAYNCNGNCYFLLSLKPDGSALNYSGVLEGAEGSSVYGNQAPLAVDGSGNAYLAGATDDANFVLTPGTVGPTFAGYPNEAGFVIKVDPTGKLIFATVLPGNATQNAGSVWANYFVPAGIAVNTSGEVTIAGYGGLGLPTTSGVLESTLPSSSANPDPLGGFILQLNADASAFNYATYIPGVDYALGLAVNASGDSYVTGRTAQTTLPVSANALQPTLNASSPCSCQDGFIAEIDGQGKAILAATYLAGIAAYQGTSFSAIALDSHSNVFVGGMTSSADFPLQDPIVSTLVASLTAYGTVTAELSPDLSSLLFGTFLNPTDGGTQFAGLTIDSQDNEIVVGTTITTDYPTTPGAYQTAPPPPRTTGTQFQHSFISKIDISTGGASVCLSPTSINFGSPPVNEPYTVNLNVQNCGTAPLQLSSIVSSSPTVTAAQSCGAIDPGLTCVVQVTFTPPDTNPVSGTLTLTDNAPIPQQTVPFSGYGGAPQVVFPATFTASDLLVGTKAEFYLSLTNRGDADWIVQSVSATGDFTADNQCTAPVAPAGSCSIGVIFAPSQSGSRTGTLTITDNVTGSPHIVQLSGNGVMTYPVPSIAGMVAVPTDASSPNVQISGSGFFPASQVTVNGSPRQSSYESEGSIQVALTPTDLSQMGELAVAVSNPTPGGGLSNTFLETVYAPIRNIGIQQAVYEPVSGMLFASVSTQSSNYANQVVEINPATAQVANAWSVGNGPNALAVSDDGQFLYVGLNGDAKVAQVSPASGTVNFAVGLGLDPINQLPMIADAIRVLPGQPHSWSVTPCGQNYSPCGEGIAVFDDATERPTSVSQSQLQPDALLFIGNNAATLFGTTLLQSPPTFYEFSISSSGIQLAKSLQSFSSPYSGGGYLDTDGTSIYVSNGEVIDPTTLAVQSAFQGVPGYAGIKVDAPASSVYFAGLVNSSEPVNFSGFGIQAFGLTSHQLEGSILMNEPLSAPYSSNYVFRWGEDGLAVITDGKVFLFKTSLTGTAPQLSLSGVTNQTVASGSPASYALTVGPLGGFTGQVTFSCGNLPQYASCSFTPSAVTLAGAPVNFTATISTSQQQAGLMGIWHGIRYGALCWLVALGLLMLARRRMPRRGYGPSSVRVAAALLALLLVLLPLAACGSGGSSGGGSAGSGGGALLDAAKGNYTVKLTASGGGKSQTILLTLNVQ